MSDDLNLKACWNCMFYVEEEKRCSFHNVTAQPDGACSMFSVDLDVDGVKELKNEIIELQKENERLQDKIRNFYNQDDY